MQDKKVYITKAKINNLISNIDLYRSNIDINNLYSSNLKKTLSKPELELLAVYRDVLENPKVLTLGTYIKKQHKDSGRWVFETIYPSFHKNDQCERIHASFENIEVPIEIQHQGSESVKKFREFFKTNHNLYKRDVVAFMFQVQIKFNLANPPVQVDFDNSGVEEIFNASGLDIENKITEILKNMEGFRNKNDINQKEISSFGYATHKAKERNKIGQYVKKIDNEGSIISKWHNYKNELKSLLKEYFRIKLNPDFEFDQNILEQLGFKPCSHCYK